MTRKEAAVAAPMEAQVIGYERIAINPGLADTANFCERERAPRRPPLRAAHHRNGEIPAPHNPTRRPTRHPQSPALFVADE